MRVDLTNRGVCASALDIDTANGVITRLTLHGGCPGLREGLARLAVGRPAVEVAEALRGVPCAGKRTSCPNEIARVIDAGEC